MKSTSRSRFVAAAAVAVGLMGLAGAAQARSNVYLNIDVPGVYSAPQPVYVDPQPVYVQPGVVYTSPPEYAPAWGWREREARREAWRREQWRREQWREHERREHEWREHRGDRHWD
jgi:hypothetical protein